MAIHELKGLTTQTDLKSSLGLNVLLRFFNIGRVSTPLGRKLRKDQLTLFYFPTPPKNNAIESLKGFLPNSPILALARVMG